MITKNIFVWIAKLLILNLTWLFLLEKTLLSLFYLLNFLFKLSIKKACNSKIMMASLLFYDAHCSLRHVLSHAYVQAHRQVSLDVQFIAYAKSYYFHLFCYDYVSRKEKFFIERFFTEYYIQEI